MTACVLAAVLDNRLNCLQSLSALTNLTSLRILPVLDELARYHIQLQAQYAAAAAAAAQQPAAAGPAAAAAAGGAAGGGEAMLLDDNSDADADDDVDADDGDMDSDDAVGSDDEEGGLLYCSMAKSEPCVVTGAGVVSIHAAHPCSSGNMLPHAYVRLQSRRSSNRLSWCSCIVTPTLNCVRDCLGVRVISWVK